MTAIVGAAYFNEERGGQVFPIVIVGSGLAGYTLAKELRKLDRESPLHIITRDDGDFYSKPMLSNALAKGKTAQALATANAEQMAKQLHATIWSRTEVTDIDVPGHAVIARGETVQYDKLVLAVGARPIRLALEGDAADAVLSVNNLADYAVFRERMERARRIVIIGSGLIGCEFANDLAVAGIDVTVIGLAAEPLDRLLPPQAGRLLREALAAIGVTWRLGASVKSVDHGEDAYTLRLADGSTITADVVFSAVGLQPELDLARRAGVAARRGICVDRYLESSAPDVFALGDCAEVEGVVLPFVMPIMQAARALAKTLSGTRTAVSYPAMPVVVKTPAHAVVVSPPPPESGGDWEVTVTDQGARALWRDARGRTVGFALTGAAVAEKQALTKELPPWLA
ncbi:MAG: FAD-dependent oxidoreductase [Gammaproteobacteria bacterium]|jgi:rubredoxin-NAD+ reductase